MNKKLWTILVALAMVLMLISPALALDPIFTKNKTGGTAQVTTATTHDYGAWVAFAGDNNKQVVVGSLSATTDSTTTGNVYVYEKENEITVSTTSTAGNTRITMTSGGGNFDANDIIIIQSPSGDVVFMETVASTEATSIALNGTLDYAIYAGYKVYEMTNVGSVPCSNTTITRESDIAVCAGKKDSPLLLYIPGKAACAINYASGQYK